MNLFTNGFNLAIKKDGSGEFVIIFNQASPSFDESGKITKTKIEAVGSYVMTKNLAKELGEQLIKLCEDDLVEEAAAE